MTFLTSTFRICVDRNTFPVIPSTEGYLWRQHTLDIETLVVTSFVDMFMFNMLESKNGIMDVIFVDFFDMVMNAVYDEVSSSLMSESYEEALQTGDAALWTFLEGVDEDFNLINQFCLSITKPIYDDLIQYVGNGLFTGYYYSYVYIEILQHHYEIILGLTNAETTEIKNRFRFFTGNENGERTIRPIDRFIYRRSY